jgi:DNA-binding GntR family transcriptional regulator
MSKLHANLSGALAPSAAHHGGIAAPATALAPKALYQQVAERLREQIFSGELAAGSWVDELKVAAAYGISRTPLREALKVLAVEGLVTMKVRRGAYVTDVSQEDVRQVYRLLGLLESDAAAWVAQHATPAELNRLSALHEQLEASVAQREAFFRLNEQFHLALLEIEGNRWRQQIVADLRKVMKLNRHHSLFKAGRLEESLAEHRELMHALEQRQAEAARACMSRHFEHGLAATQAGHQAAANRR